MFAELHGGDCDYRGAHGDLFQGRGQGSAGNLHNDAGGAAGKTGQQRETDKSFTAAKPNFHALSVSITFTDARPPLMKYANLMTSPDSFKTVRTGSETNSS
jgi:hypothetical protein